MKKRLIDFLRELLTQCSFEDELPRIHYLPLESRVCRGCAELLQKGQRRIGLAVRILHDRARQFERFMKDLEHVLLLSWT